MKIVKYWNCSCLALKLRLSPLEFDESCELILLFKFGFTIKAIDFEV